MFLLFNMLSRFVIAFLRRSKSLLISWQHLLISCHLNELQGDIGGTINDGNQWDADHLESFSPKEKEDESPSFLLISSSYFSHPWEDSHLPPTTHFPSRMLQLDCLFLMELKNLFVHRAHFSHLLFWQGRCLFGIGINWDFHLWSDADGITEKWRQRRRGKAREPQHSPLIVAPNTLGTVSSSAYTFSHLVGTCFLASHRRSNALSALSSCISLPIQE